MPYTISKYLLLYHSCMNQQMHSYEVGQLHMSFIFSTYFFGHSATHVFYFQHLLFRSFSYICLLFLAPTFFGHSATHVFYFQHLLFRSFRYTCLLFSAPTFSVIQLRMSFIYSTYFFGHSDTHVIYFQHLLFRSFSYICLYF